VLLLKTAVEAEVEAESEAEVVEDNNYVRGNCGAAL
jgi:hypothetical protein